MVGKVITERVCTKLSVVLLVYALDHEKLLEIQLKRLWNKSSSSPNPLTTNYGAQNADSDSGAY